jgi:cell division protein FtsN
MAVEKYGSSKTDVIVKLVLVFFMSLLSFTMGTYVGKKFSDNQHKLSQMEPASEGAEEKVDSQESREVASVSASASEIKPKDALNDDEIKKLAEEFVADDHGDKAHGETKHEGEAKHEAGHDGEATHNSEATHHNEEAAHTTHAAEPSVHAEAHEHGTAAPNKDVLKKAHDETPHSAKAELPAAVAYAKKVAEGKGGEPDAHAQAAQTNRVPQSMPKELGTSTLGKYTVQVSSYPTEPEAEKMASDLKSKGFAAFYVTARIKDKTWYRVSVGIFATQQEADVYKNDLINRAKVSSAIVQKITK